MNLNLSIKSICQIVEANLVDNVYFESIIQNVVIDTRSPIISNQSLFISLKGSKAVGTDYISEFVDKGGRVAIVEKAVDGFASITQIVVSDALLALQKIARFHRHRFKYPVIAITGSNGKTMVKEWLYFLLKNEFSIIRSPKSFNSQIGVALSLLEMSANNQFAIIEAGISKTQEMDRLVDMIEPTIGVFTGLGVAHNEGFGDINPFEIKRREKFKLFTNVDLLIEKGAGQEIFVHKKGEIRIKYKFVPYPDRIEIECEGAVEIVPINKSDNASAINICICYLTYKYVLNKKPPLKLFQQLPSISMRLEVMEGRNGNTLINDAYNLDEKSLEIGLQFLTQNHYEEPRVLIISEVGINQNESVLNRLEDKLKFLGIEQIIYIGEIDQQENYPFITYFFKSGADYLLTPIEFQNTRILFTGNRLSKLEKIVSHYLAKKHITQLNIDLTKLRSNLNVYRSKISANTEVLAMVKAHSYGGGIVEVAKFLESEKIAYLGVAYADEGILLRNNGVQMKILVMNPEPGSFNDMIDYKLEPSIYSLENLDQFIHQLILKNEMNFPVHIKLETGMNRLGFVADEIESLIDLIKTQPEVYVKSVFSHLAVADEISKSEFTRLQINRFSELSKKLEIGLGYSFVRHIANSSAAINFPSAHFDMIRIGMGLFGLLDYEELQNVLTFTSEISQVKKIEKGDSVGYGQSYIAPSLQYIAIVPVGYADGLRRSLGNGNWEVIIKGEKYPIIGNVCMDMCMVNLGTDIFQVGDSVQVFGDGNTVQTMSKRLNTIPYEIISSISARVKRVYLQ